MAAPSSSAATDLEHRMFGGDADTEREPVEAGSAMNVESAASAREEALIGPSRGGQDGPVDSERDEADLSSVSVSREDEIDLVLGQRVKAHGIVEQEQTQVSVAARKAREEPAEVFAVAAIDEVGTDDLDGTGGGL